MARKALIIGTLLLGSCGMFNWVQDKAPVQTRTIASSGDLEVSHFDEKNFSQGIEEKLYSLHIYYVIGQQNLQQFDELIAEVSAKKLLKSKPYLKLLAIRTQVEEIENELKEVYVSLLLKKTNENAQRRALMELKINDFARKSKLASMSMENLISALGMSVTADLAILMKTQIDEQEITQELKKLEEVKEFQIYQTNVDHLSYMLEINSVSTENKFYPSTEGHGNITGNEFPAKVWALTFDDGPGKATSPVIVKNLKDKNLRATFFQLASQVKALPTVAMEIKLAGMDIASHSYTHLQLTKVGNRTLEKEITEATALIEKLQGVDIEFYRLPYGAGVSVPHIRQKIANNKLIHVFWNIDTLDWMAQTPDKIITRTKKMMKKTKKDAGVILFHDIHVRTTIASAAIMDFLKQDGRRSCTLKEIVSQMNQGAITVCP